jgi:hypothetical protein
MLCGAVSAVCTAADHLRKHGVARSALQVLGIIVFFVALFGIPWLGLVVARKLGIESVELLVALAFLGLFFGGVYVVDRIVAGVKSRLAELDRLEQDIVALVLDTKPIEGDVDRIEEILCPGSASVAWTVRHPTSRPWRESTWAWDVICRFTTEEDAHASVAWRVAPESFRVVHEERDPRASGVVRILAGDVRDEIALHDEDAERADP